MLKLTILIIIICASILAGIQPSSKSIYFLFENTGYYFILVSFFLWSACLITLNFAKLKFILLKHYDGLLLSTLLMVLIFCIAPPKFKVLNDETNLVGVSMNMYQSKQASIPIQGFNLDYRDPEYKTSIGKRPLLYPLLVSFVHGLRGYSAYNGFVANFIFGILTLFVFYLFIHQNFSRIYGLLSILIIASLPNFVMWVTSSGFETLNLLFIVVTIFLFKTVITSKSVQQAEFLFLTLVLLAQCRYESILFIIAILFLLPMLLNKKSISELSVLTFITPILFIPTIWQPRLYAGQPLVNKVASGAANMPNVSASFSFSNILPNSASNLNVFLGLDPRLGFSWVVSAISIGGFYLMTKRLIVDHRNTSSHFRSMWFYAVITYCLLYLVQVSFYLGNMTIYTQNRFAMTYLPGMAFASVFFIYEIFNKANDSKKIVILIFFIFHLLFFWPYGSRQQIVNTGSIPYEYNQTLKFLKDNYKQNSNILIISDRPNLYLIHYKGAVDFTRANQNPEKTIDHYGKEFDHVLVLQKCQYKNRAPLDNQRLNPSYRLAELKNLNLTQTEYLKISRLIIPPGE